MSFGLIFDVDGVLVDTEPLSMRTSNLAFETLYGIRPREDDHAAFMGTTATAHALGIAKIHNIDIDAERVASKHVELFLAELVNAENLAFNTALDLLDLVTDMPEWRLGLATSSPRERSAATLSAAGYETGVFEAWITGDDIKRSKPDPEIYQRAALALGVPPRRCVVIEDAVAGVAAAKAAGMTCIAVTHTFPGEKLREADRIVDSLRAVDATMLYDLIHEAGDD